MIQYESLHEGVPAWLRQSLEDWTKDYLTDEYGVFVDNLLQQLERDLRLPLDWPKAPGGLLMLKLRSNTDLALDVVDYLLHRGADPYAAVRLNSMLEGAGSAWRVGAEGETFALERRVPEGVEASARAAIAVPGPGEHLSRAWSAAYGRQPTPSVAYGEAVKAVEAAAQPVVTPADRKATLGKMITALRDAPGKWEVVLAGPPGFDQVEVARLMAEVLWKGQTDRHGNTEPVPVTQAQAEAAVQLAVLLVQWFVTGAIRRVG